MKITFLIISKQVSGAEHVVGELARVLSEDNDITLICNKDLQAYYSAIPGLDLQVLPYSLDGANPLKRIWIYWQSAQKVRTFLRRSDAEVVNVHLLSSILIMYLSGLSRKLPIYITLHGTEIKKYLESTSLTYKLTIHPLLSRMLQRAKKIITISKWQREKLCKVYSYPERLVQIPNGVDARIFRPTLPPKRPVVLSVGRLIAEKGVPELLAVAKRLPDVEFWFAGTGPLWDAIVGDNVKLLGFVPHDDLVKLYTNVTLGVFPSHHEAFPLVGLEAMAAGRPIVCTAIGFDEYAQDGVDSLFVKIGDVASLRAAIEKLVNDKILYDRLAKNARQTALRYDWRSVAQQYKEIFQLVKG